MRSVHISAMWSRPIKTATNTTMMDATHSMSTFWWKLRNQWTALRGDAGPGGMGNAPTEVERYADAEVSGGRTGCYGGTL